MGTLINTLSRTVAVMNAVRARIAQRSLLANDRLPSIRRLAAEMGVSPSTVVEAYDRLVAEGLIRARRGSGFYVAAAAAAPSLALAPSGDQPRRELTVDPFWVSRQSLDADAEALMPGCGWLPADWMPADALRRAMRSIARAPDPWSKHLLSDYGATRGSTALRGLLRNRFATEGLEVATDQLLLTISSTQAMDLICRLLLRPDDTVLVDDPCYFNFRALFRAHQLRVIGVPYTATGPDIAHFEDAVRAERPRLYLTVSALQNPTGATLSARTAHQVLTLAARHELIVVEDDIFADFEAEPSVRLAALDGLNRVVRIGSFSKTVSASVRCGYIAARRDWIEDLIHLQIATTFGGPSPLVTEMIAGVLAGGSYRKHMEDLRLRLTRVTRTTIEALRRLGIEPWLQPRGGFQLWCRLPDGVDSADVARAALADNVVLAPGNVFSVSNSHAGFMRFNVSRCTDPRVFVALRRALAVAREAGQAIKQTRKP